LIGSVNSNVNSNVNSVFSLLNSGLPACGMSCSGFIKSRQIAIWFAECQVGAPAFGIIRALFISEKFS
jgi:hypothetical protein